MNKKLARVLNGFTELDKKEKAEFIINYNMLISGNLIESRNIEKKVNKISGIVFGPSPNSCPCCGK
ncbi:MAG: hypothetical protein QM504_09170 [Pseudomonadota bacterium]